MSVSLLSPYTSFSASIYHCPADHALSDVQKSAGWTRRVRSVAMNAMVGDPGSLLMAGVSILTIPIFSNSCGNRIFPIRHPFLYFWMSIPTASLTDIF